MSADRSADYQLSKILIHGRSYVYQLLAPTELCTMAASINPTKKYKLWFLTENIENRKGKTSGQLVNQLILQKFSMTVRISKRRGFEQAI